MTHIGNLSPTLPLSPSPFHPSEQERLCWSWTCLTCPFSHTGHFWSNDLSSVITILWASIGDCPWFPLLIDLCKSLISHYIYSSFTLKFLVATCSNKVAEVLFLNLYFCKWRKWPVFQRFSVHGSSQGDTGGEQLIQVCKAMGPIQETIVSLARSLSPFTSQVQMLPEFRFIFTLTLSIINTMYSSLGILHSWWHSIFKMNKITFIYRKVEKEITGSSCPVTQVEQERTHYLDLIVSPLFFSLIFDILKGFQLTFFRTYTQ